ncbi:MAG: SpoIIE family protein phosphatase [bacterium]|nr:SpoIIE family protein phosphatase [bacterium]
MSDSNPTKDTNTDTDEAVSLNPGANGSDAKSGTPGANDSDAKPVKEGRRRSLSVQIGMLYILLALINITFFSVVILENQSDLLLVNFKYQAESIVKTVLDDDLQEIEFSPNKEDLSYRTLVNSLKSYDVQSFHVFTAEGDLWYEYVDGKSGSAPADDAQADAGDESNDAGEPSDEAANSDGDGESEAEQPAAPGKIDKELQDKTREFTTEESLFRSRYAIDLNEKDFSLNFLIPLKSKTEDRVFLNASLSVSTIQERLNYLYYQVALAVVWGVIFHVAFALFVYRVIFRRVGYLKDASDGMASGALETRADWKRKKSPDELDELGDAFNSMASNIETQVQTITKLNGQIQNELEIGQEVQELFLGDLDVIKEYKPALYYRPLRKVSGDVYQFYKFRNGYKGVFFADASGHGVSAALVTTITILSLEEALKSKVRPSEVMARLSDLMAVRLDTSFFATAAFLLFDPQGRTYITNAGHNDPIFLSARGDKVITEISSHGPPLGFMEDMSYKMNLINTRSGDKIFLYTDGLVETTNAEKEQYGLERLHGHLKAHWQDDNQSVSDLIEREFTDFAVNYIDDVSFLMLEIP